jgi:uncharacterized protein
MIDHGIARGLVLVLHFSGLEILRLAPYILVGVALGEAIKLGSWTKLAYRHLSAPSLLAVLAASVLGMASPLCTYGTVPVVLRLHRAGIPIAPLATFLAASSMMNPQLFLMTAGGLGPGMALARCASILAFSLFLGALLYRLPPSWIAKDSASSSAEEGESILQGERKRFGAAAFARACLDSLAYLGPYVLVGVLLGSALEVLVPKGALAALLGGGGLLPLLASSLAGIPLYACGGGAIPVVSGLLAQGMSRGSALAFLFVGPATRPAPLAALATVLRPRALAGYLLLVVAFSILVGVAIG